MKINILDSSVYNLIAAGEVVERPASVIKELTENAIDAGATEIMISISDGGIEKITVSDNGIGINYEDLPVAFLAHTTSKIADKRDLFDISTLGFRGEALASIASVSKILMDSRESGSDFSGIIEIEDGKIVSHRIGGRNKGTSITVSSLFYNTPARLKFLKTARSEQTAITSLVQKLILANPEIAFTYEADGKTLFYTDGSSSVSALYAVFDKGTAESFREISVESRNFRLSGFIGLPSKAKPNRNYQTFVVNGRFVESDTVRAALEKAYAPFLMKHAFPAAVLNLVLPFDTVDANVHPAKTEVRFSDGGAVFGFIYKYVAARLTEIVQSDGVSGQITFAAQDNNKTSETDLSGAQESGFTATNIDENAADIAAKGVQPNAANAAEGKNNAGANSGRIDFKGEGAARQSPPIKIPDAIARLRNHGHSGLGDSRMNYSYTGDGLRKEFAADVYGAQGALYDGGLAQTTRGNEKILPGNVDAGNEKNTAKTQEIVGAAKNTGHADNTEIQEIFPTVKGKSYTTKAVQEEISGATDLGAPFAGSVFSGRAAGQLFSTYLIVEQGDVAYFIDQHAAHERILFDELSDNLKTGLVQSMLIPFVREFGFAEFDFLSGLLEDLRACGFDIDEFGDRTLKISAVPLALTDINFNRFFDGLLSETGAFKSLKLKDLLRDKLASAACRAAIKGGDTLSPAQTEALLKAFSSAGTAPLSCPHGRPAVLKLTKRELEKMFCRIV
ncbi:MAG: DNA mismatch repair endonuclease MutL [Clostridiaceae bacterium]|jgi:DNA mismatch repair protein MutL|nr:DNA mismatch repair endonuclease MutL [Clostridiaceae bacterium]